MRILHTLYDHPKNPWVGGGGSIRAVEINRRLAAMGHEIVLYCGSYPGATETREGSFQTRFLGSRRNYTLSTLSFALQAAARVRNESKFFDVVVEDFAPWNPVFSCWLSKAPAVLHINHREGANILKRFGPLGLPFYLADMFYVRLFKNVTALSEGTRMKINRPDAPLLPVGIDDRYIKAEPEYADEGYIAYVGRMEINNKGLDTLIEAMKLLPGVKLKMAGRGRDEERIRRMAEGLDVEMLGFVSEEEKMELIRKASCFALPSRFEGWGIVLLEAAAMKTPVITSSIPEVSFASENGFGLSFETGNAASLAERISGMMKDPLARQRMGLKGRAYSAGFSWDAIASRAEALLKAVAAGQKPCA